MINPIVLAVPVFLLLMALEYALSRHRGQPVYRAADTVGSLSLGIVSQLAGAFTKLLALGVYTLVYQHWAVWPLPADSVAVWLGALLAYDFLYYWYHRAGHEVNLLWAAHAVHHSSEEYNLSTALRQTGSGALLGWLFYLPMAVVGVPPLVFVGVGLIDLLYQFWVHTRLVGRLGWFDRVFVSPSNHRVHHGQNAYCIDRNYGGILILWDRLFGSFADEREGEPIVYGIRGALRSWNPVWANLHGYANIARAMAEVPGLWNKLQVIVRPPGWRPGAGVPPADDAVLARFQRFSAALPPALAVHGLLQLAVLLTVGLHFLMVAPQLPTSERAVYALVLVAQLAALSRLPASGLAGGSMEGLRLASGVLLLALSPWHGPLWLALAVAATLAGAVAWQHAARAPTTGPASPAG